MGGNYKKLKEQNYLVAFQSGLKMYYSKTNQTKVNFNFLFYIASYKVIFWLLSINSIFFLFKTNQWQFDG